MATSPLLLSPSSSASYDLVSSVSGSLSDRADTSSDDEVVWLPHGSVSSHESSVVSDTDDDDFVLLSRPRSPLRSTASAEDSASTDSIELSSAISQLSLGQTSASHRPAVRGIGIERPSSTVTLKKAPLPSKLEPSVLGGGLSKSQKKKVARKKAARKARKAARPVSSTFPVVDDASSDAGSASSVSTISGYEDAASFITSFLSSPESKSSVCKLTLLHSLIIELGLLTASCSLPGSLTAAKALLKANAHINIKEYIAVREQGQAALRNVMHPSRSALVKDIRKRGNRASLKWVKSRGLQVLLVNCFH